MEDTVRMAYVIELGADLGLELVGGKALNLARLCRAGFAVPPGFVVTTAAYRDHLTEIGGQQAIDSLLQDADPTDPQELAAVSEQIRQLFETSPPSDRLRIEVAAVVATLGEGPLAVRSSATAEDLPGLSFAGQQDTYLNVVGADDVLANVTKCWASLWTARAISYRNANGLRHADVALAVVVQRLVDADVSGVLFTANPVTGLRTESVVDATYGLGEALVSGQVEPDHYVLDTASGRPVEIRLGAKAVRTVASVGGGLTTESVSADEPGTSLSTDQLQSLARLARAVVAEYGSPQDVEWAFAGDELFVLQSRSITSLFDVPVPYGGRELDSPLPVWFSFGAFQGVLGPITPLGRDAIAHAFAGVAWLAERKMQPADLRILGVAGERLWLRVDGVLRHPLGRRVLPVMLGFADPASTRTIRELLADPRLAEEPVDPWGVLRLWRVARQVAGGLLGTMSRPEHGRQVFEATARQVVVEARERQHYADQHDQPEDLLRARVWAARRSLRVSLRVLLPAFGPVVAPSVSMVAWLRQVVGKHGRPGDAQLPLELLRGLPGNVTTDMDLALWRAAVAIKAAGEADWLMEREPAEAAEDYARQGLPPITQAQLTRFLQRYGMRGVAEIDLGRPRWRENPTPVLATLRGYVSMEDPERSPDVVYERAVETAQRAALRIAAVVGNGPAGPFRAAGARFAARRIRALMGARETPKFTIIQVMGAIRESLLASGADLADEGWLDRPDDIIYLTLDEMADNASRTGWRDLVRQRRAAEEREARRRAVPRVIAGDGRAFHGYAPEAEGAFAGSPVSPGVVEGLVRVVDDPHTSQLQPGEILVCAGTDPAWTPLFLSAGGLITEVGGMMTHGSVVAREYGIPAVVGVLNATTRLRTGTRIRLDGSTGVISELVG